MKECSFAAFLFDLDGTLVDSSQVVYDVMKKWCIENNIDFNLALQKGTGSRTKDTVAAVAPHLDAQYEVGKIEEREASSLDGLQPMPGAKEFLRQLPSSSWAIVTSSTLSLTKSKLSKCGMPEPDVIVSADCVKDGKPHPEPYEKAISQMRPMAGECLAFEDADNGVVSALDAGCKVVVIGTKCRIKNPNIIATIADFSALRLTVGEFLCLTNAT